MRCTRAGALSRLVEHPAPPTRSAALRMRLEPRPFGLDTVVVVRAVGPELGRETFDRRRASGRGVFLDSGYVARCGVVVYWTDIGFRSENVEFLPDPTTQ
jgi:hypothetical protein